MNTFDQIQGDIHIEKTMGCIFLHMLLNWHKIKEIEQVMNTLDMNTNSLCISLKNNDPTLRDHFIQAYVLSFFILVLYLNTAPLQTIINNESNLLESFRPRPLTQQQPSYENVLSSIEYPD